jgi:hypothetical protein
VGQENNLSLNVNKTREHAPIHIKGTALGKVESYKFLMI